MSSITDLSTPEEPVSQADDAPSPPRKAKTQRVGIGFALAGALTAVIFAGGWWWTGAALFALFQGFRELTVIYRAKGVSPSQAIVLAVGVALILLAHFGKTGYILPIVTLGIISGFIRLLFRQPRASINDIGATFLAIFYVGFLPMHFILLRNLVAQPDLAPWLQPGAFYVFFTSLVIAMSDVGAYYAGRLFGRRLLYPAISPKKTREGAVGGLIIGLAFGLGFAGLPHFNWIHAVILSLLLIVVAQLGDLAESLMKRDAGVKDSGGLFLGHGGLLDRLDSFLFCGVTAYYYIHWVILRQGVASEFLHWLPR
ncbi:MAG: phosphatidate cytidylyltransferase [Vampirovibrionales bacterium]|nr:phosphatidate cytidylyltransferase [Vampirovibrionales bacterium]